MPAPTERDGSWQPSGSFWSGRSVAVTGGTGFVGSHLVSSLVGLGSSVVVLSRDDVPPTPIVETWLPRVAVVHGRVEDQSVIDRLLGEYEVRTVFHLAAQSQVGVANRNPVSTFESNIAGTWTLLDGARRSASVGQVIVASSDKAYGSHDGLPYREEMPLRPCHPYDVSKACADLIAATYASTYALPVAVTRCGNIFGPGDVNWDRLVPGTIRSLLSGERPVIRSDGSMVRDYLYVDDAVAAYLRLGEALEAEPSLAGEAFNFSIEAPCSVLELVGLIQRAAGTGLVPDVRGTASAEIPWQALSAERARSVLGWRPAWDLQKGLEETVSWYREFFDRQNS